MVIIFLLGWPLAFTKSIIIALLFYDIISFQGQFSLDRHSGHRESPNRFSLALRRYGCLLPEERFAPLHPAVADLLAHDAIHDHAGEGVLSVFFSQLAMWPAKLPFGE
jgi:hypothetical protein